MRRARTRGRRVQVWVELTTDDPEAVSALAVARSHLPAGRTLEGMRRMRLFELAGPLPARAALEDLLHRSTQFYNPHKERCTVRVGDDEPVPGVAREKLVVVWETGGERRAAAERWWQHETGRKIEVREGVAWALRFAAGTPADAGARELSVVRDRRHGLLCNPHAQEARVVTAETPTPWIAGAAGTGDEEQRGGGA